MKRFWEYVQIVSDNKDMNIGLVMDNIRMIHQCWSYHVPEADCVEKLKEKIPEHLKQYLS